MRQAPIRFSNRPSKCRAAGAWSRAVNWNNTELRTSALRNQDILAKQKKGSVSPQGTEKKDFEKKKLQQKNFAGGKRG